MISIKPLLNPKEILTKKLKVKLNIKKLISIIKQYNFEGLKVGILFDILKKKT